MASEGVLTNAVLFQLIPLPNFENASYIIKITIFLTPQVRDSDLS